MGPAAHCLLSLTEQYIERSEQESKTAVCAAVLPVDLLAGALIDIQMNILPHYPANG